ncbi:MULTISPECIES: 2-amino-3,7-dideoxy-D-threo-hept-6-ulosonate synthase [Bacillus cereus group]|uniref:Deoxyribose-phosphate aldolase n=1 Tax=Bacillus cereus TaxID=1396 RepID=A0A9W7UWT4_BACCE|nr:2-amino-3,7-dideoxy-D-threo-hept-6-ulosonate synthase [Bacillus cereus]KAB2395345.1 deoxyribose-phosphate aldolase [Bacillus cereus]KAB2408099.1 deoxyribose-phosphate aldolase [Bacillus cereus]KAB2430942.1 deoxyribose-phosphate aldolase [Bacillus cereus]MCU4787888.1 2-amino-3,7-dideoxy-D-threo-hept-6-ulosonate synthase [Bacillus cereus]MCU5556609.1 2-amino-3,7-dideoxy-D-threo-hept-6-ulosonate synthase [Bacillus cereus]
MSGKQLRLSRIINSDTNKACIVPIDHGTTLGPIKGLPDYIELINSLIMGGTDGIVLHKGILSRVGGYPHLSKGTYLAHLSVSTILNSDSTHKVLVCTVEEAIKHGADGISVHINIGSEYESEMIKKLGDVSKACNEWGMPLLAMMYSHKTPKDSFHISHVARIGEELGADIIKVDYPGSIEDMEMITKSVQAPVLIAGGSNKNDDAALLSLVNDALIGGAAGISIGRNIFQHDDPAYITNLVSSLVHGRLSFNECLEQIENYKLSIL